MPLGALLAAYSLAEIFGLPPTTLRVGVNDQASPMGSGKAPTSDVPHVKLVRLPFHFPKGLYKAGDFFHGFFTDIGGDYIAMYSPTATGPIHIFDVMSGKFVRSVPNISLSPWVSKGTFIFRTGMGRNSISVISPKGTRAGVKLWDLVPFMWSRVVAFHGGLACGHPWARSYAFTVEHNPKIGTLVRFGGCFNMHASKSGLVFYADHRMHFFAHSFHDARDIPGLSGWPGPRRYSFDGSEAAIFDVSPSSDDLVLVSPDHLTVSRINAVSGKVVWREHLKSRASAVAVSESNRLAAVGEDQLSSKAQGLPARIELLDMATGRWVETLPLPPASLSEIRNEGENVSFLNICISRGMSKIVSLDNLGRLLLYTRK